MPFPTVNGGSERLDVYLPSGGPSAAGRPVLIAIHGGGWRRLDKAGYGARIASAFVPKRIRGRCAELSSFRRRNRPTWPVNLEDVQAAVRWVRENASYAGDQSERDRGDRRVGGCQSGGFARNVVGRGARSGSELVVSRGCGRLFDADRSDGARSGKPAGGPGCAASSWVERPNRCRRATRRRRRSIMFRRAIRRCFWCRDGRIR